MVDFFCDFFARFVCIMNFYWIYLHCPQLKRAMIV